MVTDKKKIALFGSGGHAKVILDSIEKQGLYEVAVVVDPYKKETTFEGLPIVPTLPTDLNLGVVALGDNWKRAKLVREILLATPAFQFVAVIHPSAEIATTAKIGAGTVIMAGACVNSSTTIGEHCIINTRASVDHDGQVNEFASIAPGAVLGGDVHVGAYAAIGLKASLIHGCKIGEHAVVGVGSVVVADVPAFSVAYGNPCKVVRERKAGDSYL